MSRTPEQIADAIVQEHHGEQFASTRDMDTPWIGFVRTAATQAAREAQTAPDFKPEGGFDYYRQQWQYLTGARDDSLRLRITGSDDTGTFHLTITPDQARRILAMLSTESETN